MTTNDTTCKTVNIYLYSRYERFWHWLQSALIVILLVTGFEANGLFTLFGFKTAVENHHFVGIGWLIAFAFFVFWLFTTGEWRQYVPTTRPHGRGDPLLHVRDLRRRPAPRPQAQGGQAQSPATPGLPQPGRLPAAGPDAERLPVLELQLLGRLGTRLALAAGGGRRRLGGRLASLSFLIVHLYMITTGHNLGAHTRAMICGWEEVEDRGAVEVLEIKRRVAPAEAPQP